MKKRFSRLATAGICLALATAALSPPSSWAEKDPEGIYRLLYAQKWYDKYREIRYWGRVYLGIRDYHYRTGDAKALRLITVGKTRSGLPDRVPAQAIKGHFMKELRRLFGDLPFHDLDEGRNGRLLKARQQRRAKTDSGQFVEMFMAAERARWRSLYRGRPGAPYCFIRVKGRVFPVLYEIRCGVTADDNLSYRSSVKTKDIGYSTPDHIVGELKTALSEMLKKVSLDMAKIRKYGGRR